MYLIASFSQLSTAYLLGLGSGVVLYFIGGKLLEYIKSEVPSPKP